MRQRLIKNAPKFLIALGLLCFAFPFAYEAAHYPWAALRNPEVSAQTQVKPQPPSVPYVVYHASEAASPHEGTRRLSFLASDTMDDYVTLPGDEITADAFTYKVSIETEAAPAEDALILLGTIRIPRIDIFVNMVEGVGSELHQGAGHLPGSALPGEYGNTVIAAHRSSSSGMQPFRYLNKLENGDCIYISVGDAEYVYEVFSVFIVEKSATWVLAPMPAELQLLTLVTCDPLVSLTDRPNRLIVWARLITTGDADEGTDV
jgi:sortase A